MQGELVRLGHPIAASTVWQILHDARIDPASPRWRCDDFLLGFAGPRHEAEEIKEKIRTFLRDELRLELSGSKTLITHAVSQAAHFLGYEIRT